MLPKIEKGVPANLSSSSGLEIVMLFSLTKIFASFFFHSETSIIFIRLIICDLSTISLSLRIVAIIVDPFNCFVSFRYKLKRLSRESGELNE